jgi:hypothetical protein
MTRAALREIVALAGALAAHGVIAGALRGLAPPPLPEPPPPAAEVAVEIELAPPSSPVGRAGEEPRAPEPGGAAEPAAQAVARSARPGARPSGEAPIAAEPGVVGGEGHAAEAPAPAPLVLPPGLDGTPVWALPGVMTPPTAPRPAPTAPLPQPAVDRRVAEQVLGGTLGDRDREIGVTLPAAGVVASALADATRAAPLGDAGATFEVQLAAEGTVTGVRFVRATAGDAAAWGAVAAAARRALGSRALDMGGRRGGATVVVTVTAKVQFPAGGKQAAALEPVCAGDLLQAVDPASGAAAPPAERDPRRCLPVAVRLAADAANLGAHDAKIVSASFQVVRTGDRALPAGAPKPIDTRVPWARPDPTLYRPPPKARKDPRGWYWY